MLIRPYLNFNKSLPQLLHVLIPYVFAGTILSELISSMAFPIATRCPSYLHYRPLQRSLHFDLTQTIYLSSPILFLHLLIPLPSHHTILLVHFILQGRQFHYLQNPRISVLKKAPVYSWLLVNSSSHVLVICLGSLVLIH